MELGLSGKAVVVTGGSRGIGLETARRFAKWEREMARRPLDPEEAERVRHEWSVNQGMRATRWGTPEELAHMIVFAASDAARYVNGAVLVADGAQDKS